MKLDILRICDLTSAQTPHARWRWSWFLRPKGNSSSSPLVASYRMQTKRFTLPGTANDLDLQKHRHRNKRRILSLQRTNFALPWKRKVFTFILLLGRRPRKCLWLWFAYLWCFHVALIANDILSCVPCSHIVYVVIFVVCDQHSAAIVSLFPSSYMSCEATLTLSPATVCS